MTQARLKNGTGGITSNIHVSMWYESTHFPEAHYEVFGNMGIRSFKKGTRQVHGEQQKLINKERWNAFSYLLLWNRGTKLLIWGDPANNGTNTHLPRRLSLVTWLLTLTPCTLDKKVWRDMFIQMQVKSTYSQNVYLKHAIWRLKNMYNPNWIFGYQYFVTIQWALDRPSCLVQERCGTLWFFGWSLST